MSWDFFREPLSGVHGRLRPVPGVWLDGGYQVYGVEVASGPDGPWIYNFDTAGRTPQDAVRRARMRIRKFYRHGSG